MLEDEEPPQHQWANGDENYAPTTGVVRLYYSAGKDEWGGPADDAYKLEFDRWLATVKADAWDEGARAQERYEMGETDGEEPVNPYRKSIEDGSS